MSVTPFVEILVALVVVNWLGRSILRRPNTMRWLWKHSQPSALGRKHVRGRDRAARMLARAIMFYAGRPLRISPFEGGGDGADPAAVSAALSAAMGRIGSLRQSGVDVVTAPVGAGTAIDAVAEAVKGAPAGGEPAAALLRLFGWLIARGELQLSGHVLTSHRRGPGIALSLATASGQVLERETIWAGEFEPFVGVDHGLDAELEADRLLRVATAGAVWAHFTILRELWKLREPERRELLQTSNWRSYAFMRVGAEGQAHCSEVLTRALFAMAVDADLGNLLAQFNLASTEVRDTKLPDVHHAGLTRLRRVHRELDDLEREKGLDPDAPIGDEELLNRDPLHYQIAYKSAATRLNDDIVLEAKQGLRADSSWPWDSGGSLKSRDMNELEGHLGELERTLTILHGEDSHAWPAAGSKAWSDMKLLLGSIEGPMLVLWAMVALRVGRPEGAQWPAEALANSFVHGEGRKRRAYLIGLVQRKALTPGDAVGLATSKRVWRTTRTRFNLACWYADIREFPLSMRELELSLECGGLAARRGIDDKQLRALVAERVDEWLELKSRYGTAAQPVNASVNGQGAPAAPVPAAG